MDAKRIRNRVTVIGGDAAISIVGADGVRVLVPAGTIISDTMRGLLGTKPVRNAEPPVGQRAAAWSDDPATWAETEDAFVRPVARLFPAGIPSVSPRQLFIAAKSMGLLTAQEAEDAAAGIVLPQFEAVISQLPADDQSAARITLARMTSIERNDPLVPVFAMIWNLSDAQLDALFTAAAGV